MADDDLARRVRDYARDRAHSRHIADGPTVSSAWLALEFAVDPRTVAAALRPYGIRPAVVEPGVRGYVVAELAAIRFDDNPAVAADGGWPAEAIAALHASFAIDPADLPERVQEPDAVERLSAGAGHDMTPALKAAGLL